LRVREICLRLLDLGGFACGLEIGELRFGLPELPRGLVEGSPVSNVVLVEKLCSSIDFDASLDENTREEPRECRTDLHEVGFGIALPLDLHWAAGAPPPPAGRGDRREREH
jgi:hypothetical protein